MVEKGLQVSGLILISGNPQVRMIHIGQAIMDINRKVALGSGQAGPDDISNFGSGFEQKLSVNSLHRDIIHNVGFV